MGGVGLVEIDGLVVVGVQSNRIPCEHPDAAAFPTVAADLAVGCPPLDDASAVTVAHGVAVDDGLCATVDVDAAHGVVDEVPVDVGAFGLFEVNAPPSTGRIVPADDRARRVGGSDRAEVVAELARIDLVAGPSHEVDTDVPAHATELAP